MTDLRRLKWFLRTEFQCNKMSDCKQNPPPCVLGLDKLMEGESPELVHHRLYTAIVGLIDVMAVL